MVFEDKELAALRLLGLTDYEARAYLVLVKMGPKKASEISFKGQVPRTKTYGAIKELQGKGLVQTIPDKPEVYTVVSPNDVLIPLVERRNEELSECDKVVQQLALSYESSKIVRQEVPEAAREFWVIRDRQKIYNRLGQLFDRSTSYIDIMTTANGLVRAYKVHSDSLERARKRGVGVRLIAPSTKATDAVAKEFAEVLDLRQIDNPPPAQYASTDLREMVFVESQPDDLKTDMGADTAILTTNKTLLTYHKTLFDFIWQRLNENSPKTHEISRPR